MVAVWLFSWKNIRFWYHRYCLSYSLWRALEKVYSSAKICSSAKSFSFLDGHWSTDECHQAEEISRHSWRTPNFSSFNFSIATLSRGARPCSGLSYCTDSRSLSNSPALVSFDTWSFNCFPWVPPLVPAATVKASQSRLIIFFAAYFIVGTSCCFVHYSLTTSFWTYGSSSFIAPLFSSVQRPVFPASSTSARDYQPGFFYTVSWYSFYSLAPAYGASRYGSHTSWWNLFWLVRTVSMKSNQIFARSQSKMINVRDESSALLSELQDFH